MVDLRSALEEIEGILGDLAARRPGVDPQSDCRDHSRN
jgi:hypothetical protein